MPNSRKNSEPLPKIDASDTISGDDEPLVGESGRTQGARPSLQVSARGWKKRKDMTPGNDGSTGSGASELEARLLHAKLSAGPQKRWASR
ncbi:hypothetical protein QSH57_004840 [Fusarium oxysporum f. sp. vasinfectum]|nr:hypothetical protein QSH57_004840 [Fusarium oxysporum f. sp. vasinfectum]